MADRGTGTSQSRPSSLFELADTMYEIDANGCYVFTGRQISRDGYGIVPLPCEPGRRYGRRRLAHRVLYERVVGQVDAGLQLDHLCRNRRCVNPDHLEPVTSAENTRRGMRATATTCTHGHEFNEQNTYMRPDGARGCRACRTDARRRYLARRCVSSPLDSAAPPLAAGSSGGSSTVANHPRVGLTAPPLDSYQQLVLT